VLTVHGMVVIPVTLLGAIFLYRAFPRFFSSRGGGESPAQEPRNDASPQEAYREA
jgi:hypothetical protein